MREYKSVVNDLQQAISDYLSEKETATQMEDAIGNAIQFINYHFEDVDESANTTD